MSTDRIAIARPTGLAAAPLVAARREAVPTTSSGAAQQAVDSGIAALQKSVTAAEAALRRLERDGADAQALQGARQQVTVASVALADALAARAQRAQDAAAAAATGAVDLYV